MRWIEIASGVRLPLSSEEQEIWNRALNEPIDKSTMDERDEEVARLMLSRGALKCFTKDSKVYYKTDSSNDIWRNIYDRRS